MSSGTMYGHAVTRYIGNSCRELAGVDGYVCHCRQLCALVGGTDEKSNTYTGIPGTYTSIEVSDICGRTAQISYFRSAADACHDRSTTYFF